MRLRDIKFVILIFIWGCNNSPNLTGVWIEKNNYQNPVIIEFCDHKEYQFGGILDDTIGYTNTLTEIHYENGNTTKYLLSNGQLTIFLNQPPNYPVNFERFNQKKYYDYLFAILDLKIQLPRGLGEVIYNSSDNNFITLINNSSEYFLSYNGQLLKNIDSLFVAYEDFRFRKRNLLFIDSNTKMAYVKKLEDKLSQLLLLNIWYVVKDHDSIIPNSCNGIGKKLPPAKNNIGSLLLLPSRQTMYELKDMGIQNYYELKNDSLYRNDTSINIGGLEGILTKEIITNKNYVLLYYIDDESHYQTFINFYSVCYNVYIKLRNKESMVRYKKEYFDLGEDEQKIIRDLIPKRMRQLYDEELQEFKTYAL